MVSADAGQKSTVSVTEAAFYLQDHFVRKSMGEMIFSGVFERHPGLRMGSIEHEVSWVPFFLFQMDYSMIGYRKRRLPDLFREYTASDLGRRNAERDLP